MTSASPRPASPGPWHDALLAARLLASDPVGLGGATVIAAPGPVRDRWLATLTAALPSEAALRRMPPTIEDERLLGGLDLAATLAVGRPVLQRGLLAESDGGIVIVPMAERLAADTAARLAAVLDTREVRIERDGLGERLPTRLAIVALDERASEDEATPRAVADRLAFEIDLRALRLADAPEAAPPSPPPVFVVVAPPSAEILEALVTTAMAFGIDSLTAPLLALRTARAAARLAGRSSIAIEDVALAARLVLGPRARLAPPEADAEPPPPEPPSDSEPPPEQDPAPPADALPPLDEILLEAVRASLPPGLLAALGAGLIARRGAGPRGGSGQRERSALRGRPAGVRAGMMRAGTRLALVDTLRAAAPWQPVRRAARLPGFERTGIELRRDDLRLRRFIRRRESVIVFCVDASGSAALQRLAETKGAIELLLAEAYAKRTYAALVVFRGVDAELALPPTRSVARAKARLAELPGGGATPIAHGIEAALATALSEKRKGREPLLLLLTDGRANIDRSGVAARPRAAEDAATAARQVAAEGIAAIVVDTAQRPRGEAAALAEAMQARYVALPFVEADTLRDLVLRAPQPGAP